MAAMIDSSVHLDRIESRRRRNGSADEEDVPGGRTLDGNLPRSAKSCARPYAPIRCRRTGAAGVVPGGKADRESP